MTIVRKLALWVSGLVVRYASSGCKQWAEGLLQETEHIESDWSALRWALGSTRVLLDRRDAPMRSYADALAAAEKFIAKKQDYISQPLYPGFLLIQSLNYAFKYFDARTLMQRVGCISLILGSLCFFSVFLLEKRRLKLLLAADIGDSVLFYKTELKRNIERPLGSKRPAFFVLWPLYIGSLALTQRGGILDHPIFNSMLGSFILLFILLSLHKRHADQRLIDNLEALECRATDHPDELP